jgi:hypothetical protein
LHEEETQEQAPLDRTRVDLPVPYAMGYGRRAANRAHIQRWLAAWRERSGLTTR